MRKILTQYPVFSKLKNISYIEINNKNILKEVLGFFKREMEITKRKTLEV